MLVYSKYCLFQRLCSSFFSPQKCKNTPNCGNRHKRAAKLYYSSSSHFSGVLNNECVFKCRALACRCAGPGCDVWVWKQEKVQPQSCRAEKYHLLQGLLLIWARVEERNREMRSRIPASDRGSMGIKGTEAFTQTGSGSIIWLFIGPICNRSSQLTSIHTFDPCASMPGVRLWYSVSLLWLKWFTVGAADPTTSCWYFPFAYRFCTVMRCNGWWRVSCSFNDSKTSKWVEGFRVVKCNCK